MVVEFNMHRNNIENRPRLKSEKGTTMNHINVLCTAVEADAKTSIGCLVQT